LTFDFLCPSCLIFILGFPFLPSLLMLRCSFSNFRAMIWGKTTLIWELVQKRFWKNLKFFYFFIYFKLIFFVFLDYFYALISKIIFKNKKNIILIYFWVKNILKNNRNHTLKHVLRIHIDLALEYVHGC
jgi:hypothetical protein